MKLIVKLLDNNNEQTGCAFELELPKSRFVGESVYWSLFDLLKKGEEK